MKLSLFATRAVTKSPVLRTLRLDVEELGDRTLPSSTPIFIAAFQIARDVTELQTDFQGIRTALVGNSDAQVVTDLAALQVGMNKVLADLNSGISATADVHTLMAARTRLGIDLGPNVSTTLRTQLTEFSRDLNGLNRHLGQVRDGISSELAAVQQSAADLTTALSSNTNPSVVADLAAMNASVSAVANKLSAGESAADDLNALLRAEIRLNSDLRSAPRTIRHDLNELRQDTRELATDLALTARFIDRTRGAVQRNVQTLSRLLASSGNATIRADLTALRAVSATLSANIATGTFTEADITAVATALTTLQTDLATTATPQVTQTITLLNTNLTALAISLAAMQVGP